jgi:hypothetical protein
MEDFGRERLGRGSRKKGFGLSEAAQGPKFEFRAESSKIRGVSLVGGVQKVVNLA